MTRWLAAAALLLAASLARPGAARAADGDPLTGTLQAIQDRGVIRIGSRSAALPFSFLNRAGQPVGFAIDLCHAIAADVAVALHRDLVEADAPIWQTGVRIVYVPVQANERIDMLQSGAIDLECGSTTANAERARSIAFSPVFFLAGTKLMMPVAATRGLAGLTVAAGAGTTNLAALRQIADILVPPAKIVEAPGLDAAYDLLAAGRVDAFASDDVLLAGFIATRPDGKRFHVVGDYLSFEPYAIGLRRDDPAFAGLVRATFARIAADGSLRRGYDRWLTGPLPDGQILNLPMGEQLRQMYSALSQVD